MVAFSTRRCYTDSVDPSYHFSSEKRKGGHDGEPSFFLFCSRAAGVVPCAGGMCCFGGVTERLKVPVLKTGDAQASVGSNPTAAATKRCSVLRCIFFCVLRLKPGCVPGFFLYNESSKRARCVEQTPFFFLILFLKTRCFLNQNADPKCCFCK